MKYIARYGHLEELPNYKEGDIIPSWSKRIAKMGSSGQSSAAHLHFDIVQGRAPSHVYRLEEIPGMISDIKEVLNQHRLFIAEDLFGVSPHITTYFGDPDYIIRGEWKFHPGYDVVPVDRKETDAHYWIHWNRSCPGKVVGVGYDEIGYGNYLMIEYED